MIRVVGAVLLKKNRIILGKRANTLSNFPGLFEFPGGKIEKMETKKEALRRELKEELKIDVNISDIESFNNNTSSHIDKSGTVIHLTLFIIKQWTNKIIINKNIHSELAYFTLKNLDEHKNLLIPGDALFIPYIRTACNI